MIVRIAHIEDLDAIMNGYISMTPLTVNRTEMGAYNKLKSIKNDL